MVWIRTSDGQGLVYPERGLKIVARWKSVSPKEKKAVIAVSMLSCMGEAGFGLGRQEFKLNGQRDEELKNEADEICKKIIAILWDFLKQGKDFDMNDVFKMVLKEGRA